MSHKRSRDVRDGHSNHQKSSSKIQKTHHNSALQSSTTTMQTTPTKPMKSSHLSPLAALDAKHPDTIKPYPHIQPYTSDNLIPHPSSTPSLPPIAPGPLTNSAFTHASTVDSKYGISATLTYERLEFLGDAYLEVIATRLIFSRMPTLPTGRQAQLRERMVRNSTLAGFARLYGFKERIRISGEVSEESGAKGGWEKIEADVFEAYVAAIVLSWPEDGFARAEEWLTGLWAGMLVEEAPGLVENRKDEFVRLVGAREVRIEYVEKNVGGQEYEVEVWVDGWGFGRVRLGVGRGVGKKEAGFKAVADAFERSGEIIAQMAEMKRASTEARKAASEAEKGKGGGVKEVEKKK